MGREPELPLGHSAFTAADGGERTGRERVSGFSAWLLLSGCGPFGNAGTSVRPRIHPVSFLYTSFSSRWDEFGQTRRRESAAAPRRGPRVSYTETVEQQPRHVRELKQRVVGRRVGRYAPLDSRVCCGTRVVSVSRTNQ